MYDVIFCTFLIYVFYLGFGAFVFTFLDGLTVVEAHNMTSSNFSGMESVLLKSNFTAAQIQRIISTWEPDKTYSFLSDDLKEGSRTWTFFNSFVFAFHLCSTIGYGDIAPSTIHGQMLCVLFGIFGIPINTLFFKVLGNSYSSAYNETVWRIQGDAVNPKRRLMADLAFFIPWTFLLVVIPSAIFMFTEKWNFLDGTYYSFITLTTVGLGDFVAGEKLEKGAYYITYKIALVFWMLHGLAFFAMVVDYLSKTFDKFCLFTISCDCKKGELKISRVIVDVEKLDLHYRLLKSEGVRRIYNIWGRDLETTEAKVFTQNHLRNLASLCENLKILLAAEMEKKGCMLRRDMFPVRAKKPAVQKKGRIPIRPKKRVPIVSEKQVSRVPAISEKQVPRFSSTSEEQISRVPSTSEKQVPSIPAISEKHVPIRYQRRSSANNKFNY